MYIRELTLLTRSVEAQAHFYSAILELPTIRTNDSAIITIGRSRLIFHEQEKLNGHYHFAFNIPRNLFNAGKEWVASRTALLADVNGITEFQFLDWNAHAFYFADADGNIAECIARHNLPNDAHAPFTSAYFLSISEIGLPTPHVLQTVNKITRHLPVSVWRGKGSESFTAVGDEEGLFIIAHTGRFWMPTQNIAAVPMETQIFIEGWPNYSIEGLPYTFYGNPSN